MNIKQFLKPNRKKVVIFIIILILLIIFRGFFNSLFDIPILKYLIRAPFLLLTFPFYFIGYSSPGQPSFLAISGLIIGIVGLIFWWIITCLLFHFYDKLKKRSK